MGASAATRLVGFWSAIAAAACSLAYSGFQLLEWMGALGSAGGPESASTPLGLALLLTPSLLLGSAFLILMAAVDQAAPPERQVFGRAALAFATAYATLISLVYFVQLTLVAPRLAAGDMAGIEFLVFTPYRSFLFAVDLLGYTFMCVATLIGAFALAPGPRTKWARALMLANGLLFPMLALQMYVHDLVYIAALWAVAFPGATLALAFAFAREPQER